MSSRRALILPIAALLAAPMALSPEGRPVVRGIASAPVVIRAESRVGVPRKAAAKPRPGLVTAPKAQAKPVALAKPLSAPRPFTRPDPGDRRPSMYGERIELRATSPASVSRPNALLLEFLGRAGAFSLNYDRSLGESASIGIGYSRASISVGPVTATVTLVPLYTNLYLAGGAHRPFVTGGATVVSADAELENFQGSKTLFAIRGSGALPNLGAGYEFRGSGGLLFRIGPYLVVAPKPMVWGGLSMGGTF